MRSILAASIVGLIALGQTSSAEAQFRPSVYSQGYRFSPNRSSYYSYSQPSFYAAPVVVAPQVYVPSFYLPPASFGSSVYSSPYGYRSFYNYSNVPTPYGVNSFYSQGTSVTPYVAGPYHSIYFDPIGNRYRYTSGTRNSPSYQYHYQSPYPLYP